MSDDDLLPRLRHTITADEFRERCAHQLRELCVSDRAKVTAATAGYVLRNLLEELNAGYRDDELVVLEDAEGVWVEPTATKKPR